MSGGVGCRCAARSSCKPRRTRSFICWRKAGRGRELGWSLRRTLPSRLRWVRARRTHGWRNQHWSTPVVVVANNRCVPCLYSQERLPDSLQFQTSQEWAVFSWKDGENRAVVTMVTECMCGWCSGVHNVWLAWCHHDVVVQYSQQESIVVCGWLSSMPAGGLWVLASCLDSEIDSAPLEAINSYSPPCQSLAPPWKFG